MATLHDTALGSNDTSGTTLSTGDALAVTAGDLVVVGVKFEGATTTVTVDTGAATPTFSVANAVFHHTGNNDLNGATAYWIATSTGTVTPRFVLGAARLFRKIRAYSFTPAGGMTLELGNVAAAEQSGTDTPSAGSANATAAGATTVFYALYGSETITPGTGWSEAAELGSAADHLTEYQLQTGAGSLTGTANFDAGGTEDVVAQMAIFNEAASGGGGATLRKLSLLQMGLGR